MYRAIIKKGILKVGKGAALLFLLGAIACPATVFADDFEFLFNATFSGTSPAGNTPWVTVEIKDAGLNTVDMTFTGANLQGTEYVDSLYLNFNPNKDVT